MLLQIVAGTLLGIDVGRMGTALHNWNSHLFAPDTTSVFVSSCVLIGGIVWSALVWLTGASLLRGRGGARVWLPASVGWGALFLLGRFAFDTWNGLPDSPSPFANSRYSGPSELLASLHHKMGEFWGLKHVRRDLVALGIGWLGLAALWTTPRLRDTLRAQRQEAETKGFESLSVIMILHGVVTLGMAVGDFTDTLFVAFASLAAGAIFLFFDLRSLVLLIAGARAIGSKSPALFSVDARWGAGAGTAFVGVSAALYAWERGSVAGNVLLLIAHILAHGAPFLAVLVFTQSREFPGRSASPWGDRMNALRDDDGALSGVGWFVFANGLSFAIRAALVAEWRAVFVAASAVYLWTAWEMVRGGPRRRLAGVLCGVGTVAVGGLLLTEREMVGLFPFVVPSLSERTVQVGVAFAIGLVVLVVAIAHRRAAVEGTTEG